KLFILSLVDPVLKVAFQRYRAAVMRNPLRLLDSIHVQSIHFEQPYEITNGEVNLCDDCTNKMVYGGKLIPSCRLDEYRVLGGLLTPVPVRGEPRPTSVLVGEEEI
ncbi:MAG: Radical domain protein, partial [Bacteroidetes bacterium]|nr:Radical domain protein [Bacteroidota bacterium]